MRMARACTPAAPARKHAPLHADVRRRLGRITAAIPDAHTLATSAPGPGPCHICAGTGLSLPHPHRDWAHPCYICTGTGLTPMPTPALGHGLLARPCHTLRRDRARSARSHLARARTARPCRPAGSAAMRRRRSRGMPSRQRAAGTGLTPVTTSAPGPGSPRRHIGIGIRTWRLLAPFAPGLGSLHPHLRRDRAYPFHICTGTGLIPATSSRGLGSSPALPVR